MNVSRTTGAYAASVSISNNPIASGAERGSNHRVAAVGAVTIRRDSLGLSAADAFIVLPVAVLI